MIFQLKPGRNEPFPDASLAEREPNGLLAFGGDLSEQRLLAAYRQGIFPWYSKEDPILWWSPDPRAVLFTDRFHVSRSLRREINGNRFDITLDRAFDQVVAACAAPRRQSAETWITKDMSQAYQALHRRGVAHSIELWRQGELVGGLYGVAIGQIFFGESMFSGVTNASKLALYYLSRFLWRKGFPLIDCQVESAHLGGLGASSIPREQFRRLLDMHCPQPGLVGSWRELDPHAG
jgi:leucyl/phenylalanyl-tRNA--protein transferase